MEIESTFGDIIGILEPKRVLVKAVRVFVKAMRLFVKFIRGHVKAIRFSLFRFNFFSKCGTFLFIPKIRFLIAKNATL